MMMMMRSKAVAIAGLLLCALPAATLGASPQGRGEQRQRPGTEKPGQETPSKETVKVQGKVVDRNGDPQAQAKVSFDGPKRGIAWTRSDGNFEFEGPTGDYTLTVKIGDKSQTFQAKIDETGLKPGEFEFTED